MRGGGISQVNISGSERLFSWGEGGELFGTKLFELTGCLLGVIVVNTICNSLAQAKCQVVRCCLL